jgi:hypothetical protein
MAMTEASLKWEASIFVFGFRYPLRGMTKKLVLEILPYDFLLHNEAENTKSTLKIE